MRYRNPPAALFIVLAVLTGPAFARTDSLIDRTSQIESHVKSWKLSGDYMDTGDVRSCAAEGEFGEYKITIQVVPGGGAVWSGAPGFECDGMCDFLLVSFASASHPYHTGKIRGLSPEDSGTCATGKPTDARPGTLRSNNGYAPYTDICDGLHDWHPLTEGTEKAALTFDGKNAAPGTVKYVADVQSGNPVVYTFSAEFLNLKNLQDRLLDVHKLGLSGEGKIFKSLELNNLNIKPVAKALRRCLENQR